MATTAAKGISKDALYFNERRRGNLAAAKAVASNSDKAQITLLPSALSSCHMFLSDTPLSKDEKI